MRKSYKEWYERISTPFRESKNIIINLNKTLTLLTYVAYPLMLVLFYFTIRPEMYVMLKLIFVPAVSFIVLSLIRDRINRPRPYETWDIDKIISKQTKGHSMPSRHVFSMTCISMVFLYIYVPAGILFLIMSALLAALRVIGGVHYPSDVIAGYCIGIVSGIIIFLI